jgi:uncharacterized SAM-binding protein YcdF (DUF218 family)
MACGFALRKRQPRYAGALAILAVGALYLLSLPLVSFPLARSTETRPPLTLAQIKEFQPEAIVILGGGVDYDAVEYEGRSVPSSSTLKRIVYAAFLARQLNLPIITTGGYGDDPEDSEGHTAAWQLQQAGHANVLIEAESHNTRENASLTKKIADSSSIKRVLLVTHAGHAERAEAAFQAAGLQALSAPTGFRNRQPWERGILLLIPTHSHFHESCSALRAHLASLYQSLRG